MMFLIGRNRRCGGRKNPLLGAMLGLFSALMIGLGAYMERHDGAHWPVSLAVVLCIAVIGAVAIRFVALSRNGGRK